MMKKALLISLIAVIFSLGACVKVEPRTVTPAPSPTPIAITAAQLLKEYTEDAAAADKKYLGKKLDVAGVAKEYGKDNTGRPYLLMTGTMSDANGVYCTFPMDYGPVLAKLEKGQEVGIYGVGAGFKDGNALLDATE